MFACVDRGPTKYHSKARTLCGASWRKRHAERAAEPARIVELPARVEYIAKDLSRNEQTFARMVRIP